MDLLPTHYILCALITKMRRKNRNDEEMKYKEGLRITKNRQPSQYILQNMSLMTLHHSSFLSPLVQCIHVHLYLSRYLYIVVSLPLLSSNKIHIDFFCPSFPEPSTTASLFMYLVLPHMSTIIFAINILDNYIDR